MAVMSARPDSTPVPDPFSGSAVPACEAGCSNPVSLGDPSGRLPLGNRLDGSLAVPWVRRPSPKEQPLGWQSDLNDGVRLNSLLAREVGNKGAGLRRAKPNLKGDQDGGREPQRDRADYPWFWAETEPSTDFPGGQHVTGHRWNHVHYTLAFKRAARLSCTIG